MNTETTYDFTTVKVTYGQEAKAMAKMQRKGWEFVTQNPEKFWRQSIMTFRKPKGAPSATPPRGLQDAGIRVEDASTANGAFPLPHGDGSTPASLSAAGVPAGVTLSGEAPKKPWFKKWWVWVLIIIGLGMLGQAMGGGRDRAEQAAPVVEVPKPSPEVETPAAAAPDTEPKGATDLMDPVSDSEVVASFEEYLRERAQSGVVLAKAVSSVSFEEGTVRVTFDPARANITLDLFNEISPFDNLAEFVGTPMAFTNDEGQRLRTRVTLVETILPDGTDLGSLTTAEIFKNGTGEEWEPGR